MKHPELKPCPFCGGRAHAEGYVDRQTWFVECDDEFGTCHQPITNCYDTQAEAAQHWNTRAQPLAVNEPRREWVALTTDQINELTHKMIKGELSVYLFAQAIEAALKERNHE